MILFQFYFIFLYLSNILSKSPHEFLGEIHKFVCLLYVNRSSRKLAKHLIDVEQLSIKKYKLMMVQMKDLTVSIMICCVA